MFSKTVHPELFTQNRSPKTVEKKPRKRDWLLTENIKRFIHPECKIIEKWFLLQRQKYIFLIFLPIIVMSNSIKYTIRGQPWVHIIVIVKFLFKKLFYVANWMWTFIDIESFFKFITQRTVILISVASCQSNGLLWISLW